MIVPDVNLLIYAYTERAPAHETARRWLESLFNGTEEVGLPWLVTVGFVRNMVNPRVFDSQISQDVAFDIILQWFSYSHIQPLNPGPRHLHYLGETLSATGSSATMAAANRVPDAHIAALAIEHDAEVHTSDEGFERYRGLRWRNPLV